MSTIYLAATRGMCAGVERAIRIVNIALEKFGADGVWVFHEVVHNRHVVDDLKSRGAVFVEDLKEIPNGKTVVFSAHGVGLDIIAEAKRRQLKIIDATCPLVSRIHRKMNAAGKLGKSAIVIGHNGHQEVVGTIGQYAGDPHLVHVVLTPEDVEKLKIETKDVIFATQTTLSVDETQKTVAALRERFPSIEGPRRDDTCFATQHRQAAIKELAEICEVILVAGSPNSSNSNRLREVAASCGARAYLIDDASEIKKEYLAGAEKIGLTAGASAPSYVVDGILQALIALGASEVIEVGQKPPHTVFALPSELNDAQPHSIVQ